MITINISECCPACGTVNGFEGVIVLDERHQEKTVHEHEAVFDSESVADPVWSHEGFEYDSCIRLTCRSCGAQAAFDVGTIEMTCTGPQSDPAPSWCPESKGEMRKA